MTETAFSGGFYETSRWQNHVGTVWKMGKKKEQKYGLLTAMRDVSLEKIKWNRKREIRSATYICAINL